MNLPGALAYYVSAHGYGHGARSGDILGAFNRLRPGFPVLVTSDLPASFFLSRLSSSANSFRAGSFDVGMVQLDSIRADVAATLERVEGVYARRPELVAGEIAFFRRHDVRLVVADIPALPLEAAAEAGIARIAVGNFGWDWIYSKFVDRDPRWARMIGLIQDGYARADLLLRLPFSDEMKVFPRRQDIPLVARPGTSRRAEIAARTGARESFRWVLLSFTSLDWNDEALDRVARLSGYEFFVVDPLAWRRGNIHAIDRNLIPFSDVLASVDGVVSKPGFGIVSECLVNRKPLVYAERTDFLEYGLLKAAIDRYLKSIHIPAARLYAGDIAGALEPLWERPEPRESEIPGS